jgi:CheY-like chemotaxis protein
MANMSHEIRTPMTAILGYSELLADNQKLDDKTRHYLAVIQDNSEMLLRLINDILDLSRIEVGRLSVSEVAVDVSKLTSECVAFFSERAKTKRIALSMNSSGVVPPGVLLDPVRLRQILLNLIGNAVKFTERGHVEVELAASSDALRIAVSDTGMGIAEAELERIFEAFWQADTEAHRRYTGFGLGLVVSRQLARLMGGDIAASSTVGQGSRFVLSLPLRVADTDARHALHTPLDRKTVHGYVLLAEDNDVNRLLLRTMLEKLGLTVLAVCNGDEALEALLADREPVDMVFMDMMMPVVDGVLATRRLRAAGFDKPIVALSASAMREEQELSLEAGCTDFAGKPISQSVLQALCERYIPQPKE